MRVSFTVQGREARHLVLEADPRAEVAEVAAAIAEAAGEPGRRYYLAAQRFGGRGRLGDVDMREGARLTGEPLLDDGSAGPPALIELRAVAGPGAGEVVPLSVGSFGIGSGETCAVWVPSAAEHAATVMVGPDGTAMVAVHEGAELISALPPDPGAPGPHEVPRDWFQPWPPYADLALDAGRDGVLLRWTAPFTADAAVRRSEDGTGLDFNRPPRIVEPLPRHRFRIPPPPPAPARRPFPLLTLFAPLVMGVGMVLLLHSEYFLIFAVFSPIFAVSNWISDRKSGRRKYRGLVAERADLKERLAAEIGEAVGEERAVRGALAPDPALVLHTATGPGHRLWERRRRDPDHLLLRLGTYDQPSVVEVDDAERADPLRPAPGVPGSWTVRDAPLCVALADRGVVGLAGPPERVRPLASWMLAQAAALHSPRDVRFVLLTDAAEPADWEWFRWLPHARPPYAGPPAMVGNDPETVARRVAELTAVVKARLKARGSVMGSAMFADPDVVVVLDGARRLRDVAGLVQILADGPAVRVYALCIDREVRLLPEEATAVVEDGPSGLVLRQRDQPESPPIRPDLPEPGWFDRLARALAPLRDATADDGGALPDRVRLLDLLELPEPKGEELAARWVLAPDSTAAVIGSGYDGPAVVDLVRDGPHALIAGTTGSGKSELLQTLVASLAVANRPDELTFLLVDYKGGSAFRDCVELPHTLGMVTDLDGHLVERALESLGAELRRRERLLAEHGVKDQPEYQAARRRDPQLPPLPRLVLVVDEFATLVREVPAFVSGVVSIAQRGRSLGLHLVLATQRPAGVVTADIRANTNLRIALRVTDPLESSDVIDTTDAAVIPQSIPGRALVRLAHRAVAAFQTAYSGGEHRTEDAEAPMIRTRAVAVPWSGVGRDLRQPAERAALAEDAERTDLSVLVEALREAAERLAIPEQPSPWLPALPPRITLAELPAAPAAGHALAPVAIGLEDLPALQRQRPLTIGLDTFDHLYVVGAARSGRSQTLRTIAAALADRHSIADVHFYGVDTGGALSILGELPHTGAVANRADIERVDRLLSRLGLELTRRQGLLSARNSANLTELRAGLPTGERPAHVVLFVDGWEALFGAIGEYDSGRLVDELMRLLREGAAAGMHVVMAGDRALLSGRMGTLNENRLMLRMTDRSDYMMVGLSLSGLPTVVAPGRAWMSGSSTEVQIAVIAADPSGAAQADAIRVLAASRAARDDAVPAGSRPPRIGALPSDLVFSDAFASFAEQRPLLGLLGLGGDDAGPLTVDFAGRSPVFLVCGPPGTGRSTVLLTLAVSLMASGTRIVALTPRVSPLRRLAEYSWNRVLTDPNPSAADLEAALEEVGTPCVVLVDDADLLAQVPAADAVLRRVVATGKDRGLGLAAAATPETFVQAMVGWIGDARRLRQGVLLNPQSAAEGDVIGARLPPNQLRRPARPGRGYTADPASGGLLQIALPLTELKARKEA